MSVSIISGMAMSTNFVVDVMKKYNIDPNFIKLEKNSKKF